MGALSCSGEDRGVFIIQHPNLPVQYYIKLNPEFIDPVKGSSIPIPGQVYSHSRMRIKS